MLLLFLNNLLAEIVITPQQWDFGTINNNKLVQNEVAIKNSDLKTVHLRLISTCICLDVQPDEAVFFTYYYDHGCRGCVIFLSRIMYKLQDEIGIKLRVVEKDIRNLDVYAEYIDKAAGLEVEERGFPALIFDNVVLQGTDEIERKFGEVLKQYLQN